MKKFFSLLILLVLFGCGGGGSDPISPNVPPQPSNGLNDLCLVMGDSILAGTEFVNYKDSTIPKLEKMWNKQMVNKAVPGYNSAQVANKIDVYLEEFKPKYVIVYVGTNDLDNADSDWILENIRYTVLQSKASGAIPVVTTMGPFVWLWEHRLPQAQELSELIRQMAKDEGIALADIEKTMNNDENLMVLPDGEHPNEKGHTVIAETLYNIVKGL